MNCMVVLQHPPSLQSHLLSIEGSHHDSIPSDGDVTMKSAFGMMLSKADVAQPKGMICRECSNASSSCLIPLWSSIPEKDAQGLCKKCQKFVIIQINQSNQSIPLLTITSISSPGSLYLHNKKRGFCVVKLHHSY